MQTKNYRFDGYNWKPCLASRSWWPGWLLWNQLLCPSVQCKPDTKVCLDETIWWFDLCSLDSCPNEWPRHSNSFVPIPFEQSWPCWFCWRRWELVAGSRRVVFLWVRTTFPEIKKISIIQKNFVLKTYRFYSSENELLFDVCGNDILISNQNRSEISRTWFAPFFKIGIESGTEECNFKFRWLTANLINGLQLITKRFFKQTITLIDDQPFNAETMFKIIIGNYEEN